MSHHDHDTEILSKLGILNSKLECPSRMKGARLENRRVRAALNIPPASTTSLSDDSDDEIVFDRNALLNARKRRRRRRSYARISNLSTDESTKWRLFCLSCTFFCLGLSTVILGLTKPDLLANVRSTENFDYALLFVFSASGFFVGSIFVSMVFTRVNAYLCLLFLLGTSIPFSALLAFQTELSNLDLFLLIQGVLFGAIERGAHLMIFGIWKGDKRVLFMFYMSLALGGAMSAVLCTEEVFSRTAIVGRTHVITKREISNPQLPTFKPSAENSTEPPSVVTRPNSAVGIVEVVDTKTKENEERRKQAQGAKSGPPPTKCGANGTNCEAAEKPSTREGVKSTTTTTKPTMMSTKPTTPSTTRASSVPSTTPKSTSTARVTQNRTRNRPTIPSPIVKSKLPTGVAETDTNARIVYLLIMAAMLMTSVQLILGFCTYCINSSLIADPRIAQLELETTTSQPIPAFVRLVAFSCWFVQLLPESMAVAFLPHFFLTSNNPDFNTQNGAAFFTACFWISIVVFRLFIMITPSVGSSVILVKFCYFVGLPTSFILHQTLAESELSMFAGLVALGFFLMSIPLISYSWLQHKLNTSAFVLSRIYFAALSLSKIVGPLLAVRMVRQGKEFNGKFLPVINWVLVLGMFLFLLFVRVVTPLARNWHLQELSTELNGRSRPTPTPNKSIRSRKGAYQALMTTAVDNESDGADVEMDYVQAERGILSDSSDSL